MFFGTRLTSWRRDRFEQHNRMCDGGIISAHAFRSFGFDPDAVRRNTSKSGNILPKGLSVRAYLRSREDQSGIDVNNAKSGGLHPPQSSLQKHRRVSPLPARIGWREECPDVGR